MSLKLRSILCMYPSLAGHTPQVDCMPQLGFSGAQLWRISVAEPTNTPPTQSTIYVLRRWPAGHPSPERLALVHEVLRAVHARGFDIVPLPQRTFDGKTWIHFDGHLWELTPWLPGQSDSNHPTQPRRLRAAFEALARFHELSGEVRLAQNAGTRNTAFIPAVWERCELAQKWRQVERGALGEAVAHSPPLPSALSSLAREILQLAVPLLPLLEEKLGAWRTYKAPLTPAIRDLHREHVLFTGEHVTGLIDFGALRIDSPLTDVARLLGSLAGDDPAARRCALEAYAAHRPLSLSQRQLIDLLDASNVVLGGLNWIKWLYLERRQFPSWPAVVRRLEEIVARLRRIEP